MKNCQGTGFYFIILLIMLMSFPAHVSCQNIPEEAQRYNARGKAAVEMAKTKGDYALAIAEFEQAAKLAPDWPNVYYNLGNVQTIVEDFSSAIKSYQRYLELAPEATDAEKVKEQIFKLEYRRDRQQLTMTLSGPWIGADGQKFNLQLDGTRLQLTRAAQQGDDILTIKSMGTFNGPMTDAPPLVFSGTLTGDKITGQYYQAAGKSSGHCNLPERKGSFEGTVDVAARQIRLVYNRVTFEYLMKFKSMLSAELICWMVNQQETPNYVLELKRDTSTPAQAGK